MGSITPQFGAVSSVLRQPVKTAIATRHVAEKVVPQTAGSAQTAADALAVKALASHPNLQAPTATTKRIDARLAEIQKNLPSEHPLRQQPLPDRSDVSHRAWLRQGNQFDNSPF